MSKRSTIMILLLAAATDADVHAGNWVPLFDGHSLSGWSTLDGKPAVEDAWRVDEGALYLDTSKGRGGHLVTTREYGNFELVFEWKIRHRANSGIKYRVRDFNGRVLGCEYQIIDDVNHGGLRPAQTTASLYDVFAPIPHQRLRPPGEYNRGCVIVCGNRIEHYLNGLRVVVAYPGSRTWNQRISASKFADVEGFGRNHCGRIMLTDHGDEVWYRNIFIRELASR